MWFALLAGGVLFLLAGSVFLFLYHLGAEEDASDVDF